MMPEILNTAKHYAKGARYLGYNALFLARDAARTTRVNPPKIKEKKPSEIKRVLLCLNRYEYGRKVLGDSYEYVNWLPAINEIAHVDFFDFREYRQRHGDKKMHEHLQEIAFAGEYDLILCSLMVDDFDKKVIRKISEESPTITMNWFSDDQWRFESFSNYWAGAFNFITTTDKTAVAKYMRLGYPNAIRTQWGVYAPRFEPKTDFGAGTETAFVGQAHGERKKMIEELEKNGLRVECFGTGWANSRRISQQEMVDIFANAKINISPSESSVLFSPKQMKARFFEIAACGGFQIAQAVGELEEYFLDGKEIAEYVDKKELVEKAIYYLENETERKKIALAGKKRCLQEHTYKKRFTDIFSQVKRSLE